MTDKRRERAMAVLSNELSNSPKLNWQPQDSTLSMAAQREITIDAMLAFDMPIHVHRHDEIEPARFSILRELDFQLHRVPRCNI